MARRARIRNLVLVRHRRGDEFEGVRTDERAGHTLCFDLRHVAGYTLTAGAAVLVVGVFLQCCAVRAVG